MFDIDKENRPILTYIVMYIYTNCEDFPEDSDIVMEMFDTRSDFTIVSSAVTSDGYEFDVTYTSSDFSYCFDRIHDVHMKIDDKHYGDDIYVKFYLKEYAADDKDDEKTFSWSGVIPLGWDTLVSERRRALEERGSFNH